MASSTTSGFSGADHRAWQGGKSRTVLMPQAVWEAVMKLRESDSDEAPVFRSRKRGHLDESAVWRIVSKASERAGIDKNVS